MDRMQRIAAFWNWLPAFRVVAEYGSIQRAALSLHLSPSALSRTIRLLEDEVGQALFVRSTTGLSLTKEGLELLEGTRDAMRHLDDALARTRAGDRPTTWSAGVCGPSLARLLARAMATLARHADARVPGQGVAPLDAPPSPQLRIVATTEDRVFEELLRGEVDLVLADGALAVEAPRELLVATLGELVFAFHSASPSVDETSACPAVAVRGAIGAPGRALLATVPTLDAAEALAEEAGCLAVLPIGLASPHFRPRGVGLATQPVLCITRRRLEKQPAPWTDDLADAIRAVIRDRATPPA